MGNEILKILNANSSVILIGCFVLLIIITIMELQKTKKMQQSSADDGFYANKQGDGSY